MSRSALSTTGCPSERAARFDSEWPGRGRVTVPFRIVLAGDEARFFPPDSSVVLRAEGKGRALKLWGSRVT